MTDPNLEYQISEERLRKLGFTPNATKPQFLDLHLKNGIGLDYQPFTKTLRIGGGWSTLDFETMGQVVRLIELLEAVRKPI